MGPEAIRSFATMFRNAIPDLTVSIDDVIAAEDTRIAARLLQHYGIGTSPQALHAHNERSRSAAIVNAVMSSIPRKHRSRWTRVRNGVPGNPIFIFRNNGGFTHSQTGGGFRLRGRNRGPEPDDRSRRMTLPQPFWSSRLRRSRSLMGSDVSL